MAARYSRRNNNNLVITQLAQHITNATILAMPSNEHTQNNPANMRNLDEKIPPIGNVPDLPPDLLEFARTPEFKEWFGDWEGNPDDASKIVRANGQPAIVYFGGPAGIKQLEGDKRFNTGPDEIGFYFTPDLHMAKFYAAKLSDENDDPLPSSVYPAFLNVRSPYVKQPGDGVLTGRVTQMPDGHDGLIGGSQREIVVADPAQVMFVQEIPINVVPPAQIDQQAA